MSEHEQSLDDVVAEVKALEERKDGAHHALDVRIDMTNEIHDAAQLRDSDERFVTRAETAAKFLVLDVTIQRLERAVTKTEQVLARRLWLLIVGVPIFVFLIHAALRLIGA